MRKQQNLSLLRSTGRPLRRRHGVVLLVVLGMLSLFTVLIVSFVVFSSQVADSSSASEERRIDELLPNPPIDAAIMQLIVGTDDSRSAAFGASLMEDFYGVDGMQMRVAHRRGGAAANAIVYPQLAGGQLLLPRLPNNTPQTTLFKFPTNLAYWHLDGAPAPPGRSDGTPITRVLSSDANYNNLKPYLDDAYSGRILTFEEGPLTGVSFRVIRSFGVDNGNVVDPTGNSNVVNNQVEYNLAGNMVIDLTEIGTETILIDGVPEQLYDIAENDPNRLLYDPGPDGLPGIPGNRVLGVPGSDDIGFRFILNGTVFNGRGVNPSGLTGLNRGALPGDPNAEIEFTLNSRLTGTFYQGGTALPEFDEAWDAADWENIFLAWQPSDHRRPLLTVENQVYSGVDSDRLNRQLGQLIIPSFHRPAVINYLMNAPIRIPGDTLDPSDPAYIERSFADIRANAASPQPQDAVRLEYLVTRLRRATLRPLNFPHEYSASLANDLNGDGDPFDGAPQFSGSNNVAILNQTIDLTSPVPQVIAQIEALARWLINGPWDVDNDGDGLPDSVWIDFNLPLVTGPDGKLLKPMIAPLVEDLDGKINLNYAGSYNQLFNTRFTTGLTSPSNQAEYNQTRLALNSFGFGGGIGPAEIDFSHLFAFERPVTTGFLGPLSTNQVGAPLSLDQVLLTRYGNLLNARYGGPVYNYASTYPYASPPANPFPPVSPLYPNNLFPYPTPYPTPLSPQLRATQFLHYPGSGNRLFPAPNSDLLSRIPFPTRRVIPFSGDSAGGRPVDIAGTERTFKDQYGSHRFNEPPYTTDVVNQPYEFGATEVRGDDAPFSPAEYVDFLAGGPLAGRLSQLLGDAADRNEALRRLVATESRAVDSPEVPGHASLLHVMAERFRDHATRTGSAAPVPQVQSTLLNRMLAVELRKGSKLNLNRQLGNALNSDGDGFGRADEFDEVRTGLMTRSAPRALSPVTAGTPTWEANRANNRRGVETAFPQILGNPALNDYAVQSQAAAHYGPTNLRTSPTLPGPESIPDFDGIDANGDGDMSDFPEDGTDVDGDGEADAIASGSELLARNLYCLMFALVAADMDASGELVPNYPYPGQLGAAPVPVKNAYVARQLAQWAANAVDYRDTDSAFTRLRYDPNPFDSNGFSLVAAAANEVWGMERPELQITETFAMHDKRLKRNLPKQITQTAPNRTADGEMVRDDDTDTGAIESDSDMDQFRKPQGSAFVELQALASPIAGGTTGQPHYPRDLYTAANALDLGRVVGNGATLSPVWRMAVGERHDGDNNKSSRWIFDADRLVDLDAAGIDKAGYLTDVTTWPSDGGSPTDAETKRDTWNEIVRYAADIRTSRRVTTDPARTEYVTLADDDFDPTNDAAGNPSRLRLERFVWFAELSPAAGLNIVNHPDSGMRIDNVYFNKADVGGAADAVLDAPALLLPGQYAVVAPRITTYFGQKSLSSRDAGPNAPPGPNSFIYEPSDQRLELLEQTTGAPDFRLNYFRNGDTDVQTPYYIEDNGGDHHVNRILPIVCQSLYPNEIPGYTPDPANFDWSDYSGIPDAEKVDMGFNISEPLPGQNYYLAPEYRINATTNAAGDAYPHRDGYRDYAGAGTGFHPDTPLDHLGTAPLAQNNHEWAAVGTHQEAATIFLQRLADPSIPWHPRNNPYITVDFMPMDLTTFNGEEDVRRDVPRQKIDGMGNPVVQNELVDDRSIWTNPPPAGQDNGFVPALRLDSRRKIPDLTKDRGLTSIIPGGGGRVVCAHRSPLSMTTSILRETTPSRAAPPAVPSAAEPHFAFNLGAMWDNGVVTATAATLDTQTRYTNPLPAAGASSNLRLDGRALGFTQSLGFVNREYGEPVISNSQRVGTFGIGAPDYVFMLNVPWMNREYQSQFDLMNVPAVSRTRLLATFNPETVLQDGGLREVPRNVWESLEAIASGTPTILESHVLGFDSGLASYRNQDEDGQYGGGRQRLGISENDTTDFDDWTGGRPGFEQIFDYVDVGPVWFDSQRWFDPAKIQFRNDVNFDSGSFQLVQLHRMFNRSVETLQPPNNFIGKHRTPGKINLNTTPDYIRKGPNFGNAIPPALQGRRDEAFLDGFKFTPPSAAEIRYLEDPKEPGGSPFNGAPIAAYPQNDSVRGDGLTNQFVNSQLFGNGSVYRSLAWGISNPFEMDNTYGAPTTLGEENRYFASVDTSFGRGFKAFIESRRGYDQTASGTLFGGAGRNPELDYRYPTRFAGVFGPAAASATPSLQRFMRTLDRSQSAQPSSGALPASNLPMGIPRRTHDMSLLRPHPDFDIRTMDNTDRSNAALPTDPWFALSVETPDAGGFSGTETPPTGEVSNLRMPLINTGLFERPQAELHMNSRSLDRDSFFRYKSAARMAGVTTHHSNVFLVRFTLGYFEVDATTGAVGAEFINNTGEPQRSRATFIIDRTIPIGFLRGRNINAEETILYAEVEQ